MSFERVCALSDVAEPGAAARRARRTSTSPSSASRARSTRSRTSARTPRSPLSEGDVEEFKGAPTIECWLHGSCFDLRTGEPTNLPATEPVAVYPVRVDGEDVYVDVDDRRRLPAAASN